MEKIRKNMCRVCSKYASGRKSIKLYDERNIKVLMHIEILTGLWLRSHKLLPELICDACNKELNDAMKFRERCIVAQQELLAALTEEQRNEIAKSELNEQEHVTIIEEPAQEEIDWVFEPIVTKEEDEFAESMMEDVNDMITRSSVDGQEEIYEAVTLKIEKEENVDTYVYDSDDEVAVLDNVLDDEFDMDIPKRKKIATRERKPKTEKSDKPGRRGQSVFICDQCGNHISGRMAFELHCRRHRGEKHYQCELCCDSFCTTSELKRHMRKHTGERPFACQYCGRRFTDYTTRVKHERTHTNERPYACTTCGKAFTTGYILKNHMLMHSGERTYRCEFCDKSFLLSTHLITHNRSSVHKRNAEKKMEAQALGLL